MSLTNKGKPQDRLVTLTDSIKSHINGAGEEFVSAQTTAGIVSFESLGDMDKLSVDRSFEEVKQLIKNQLSSVGLESIGDAHLDAAAVAALAAGNPASYARTAYTSRAHAADGVTLVNTVNDGLVGSFDFRDEASLEAFDDRELREHLSYSIVFNAYGSRQDPFCEMFFPTTTITPDQAGIDMSVQSMYVFPEVRRAIGKVTNFGKKRLIDAAVDATILADESTRLVPAKEVANAANFLPTAVHATKFINVAGVDVPTAPLLMNKEIDLLAESSYAALIGAQVLDNTDAIDARIMLESLYLVPAANQPAVKFNTSRLPKNTFTKTVEGNFKDMQLQFSTVDIIIDKNTRAYDGTVVDEFADIDTGDYVVRLSVDINGKTNVEIGTTKVWSSSITVNSITDVNGNAVGMTSGAGLDIKTDLEAMSFGGYELRAYRTNSNRRTRGLTLDTTVETERYTIPLGTPLNVPAPTSSNRDAADLKALINASRLRNSNNGVTTLLNYAAALKEHVRGPKRKDLIPQVAGMGRFLVEPFFEEHNLDMVSSINSLSSHEKADDVSAVLVNALRDLSYRMLQDSRYQAALDQANGGTGEKPKLIIGTDQFIGKFLMVTGDNRTFAEGFESFQIETSMDSRVKGKIFVSFRRTTDGPDALSFGTHAWIPELASTIQVSRGGTWKETMVQPRSLHVTNLPILGQINVLKLTEALSDKIAQATVADVAGNVYLDGVTAPTP